MSSFTSVNIYSPQNRIQQTTRTKITTTTIFGLFGLTALIFKGILQRAIRDQTYLPLLLFILLPINILYFSYACNSIVSNIHTMCSRLTFLKLNSTYYSAVKTALLPWSVRTSKHDTPKSKIWNPSYQDLTVTRRAKSSFAILAEELYDVSQNSIHIFPERNKMPYVIVHMPVYKESLTHVIAPSCQSVMAALQHYRECGGKCKLFISDDGLQCIHETEQRARIQFYRENQITYVARPVANRAGRFKKASNLNYTYRRCEMATGIENSDFVYGDLEIPADTLILLVDADTRVPATCITDTVPEFMKSPDLPYTQHFTLPFPIPLGKEHDYWMALISHFTEHIYRIGIGFSTALGGCCPLVGHNAFLRYSFLKDVGYWSENSVCEDFDLFLRFATKGLYGRYVMYTGPEFQEGVSLTFKDEVIKFKKFTFGALEMTIRPFREWIFHGPFTHLFTTFLRSQVPWDSKCQVIFYLSTYFAMSNAFYWVILDTFIGLYYPEFYRRYMARGLDVMIGCVVIFAGIATMSQLIFNKKMMKQWNVWNELKWIPMFTLFFSGTMFHMTESGFRYMFDLESSWGATHKDPSKSEISVITSLKDTITEYRVMYGSLACVLGSYMYMHHIWAPSVRTSWSLYYYVASHMIAPILFDPSVISFVHACTSWVSSWFKRKRPSIE